MTESSETESSTTQSSTTQSSETQSSWSRGEKEFDAEVAEHKAYVDAIYEVAKGSIDRSRDAAKGVQTAATAVGVIYTGVLGLVFSVTGNPLPPRGLLTPIFLGLAIVLTSAYSAYITRVVTESPYPSTQLQGWLEDSEKRVIAFIHYTKQVVEPRSFALRASVVALALSLLFIAAPFVSFDHPSAASTTSASIDALKPAYPTPTATSATPTKLDEILYQAQVDDAATLRKAQLATLTAPAKPGWTDEDRNWFVLAGLALIAGGLVALMGGGRDPRKVPSAVRAE